MRENALAFLDQFGIEAFRLGWTAPQLFGVHPVHGTVRVDYCGALMIAAAPVLGSRRPGCCSSGPRPTGTCPARTGACRSGSSQHEAIDALTPEHTRHPGITPPCAPPLSL
jgi:hypothetical protein